MSQKQSFEKAVNLYIKKYQMNLDNFLHFLNQKVVLSSFELQCIASRINTYQSNIPLNRKDIVFYLHCVAAVQTTNKKIDHLEQMQIQSFFKIKFKSKKGKKEKEYQVSSKIQSIIQPQNQTIDNKQQIKHKQQTHTIYHQNADMKKRKQPQYEQIQDDQSNQNDHKNRQPQYRKQQKKSPKKEIQYKSILKSPQFHQMHQIKQESGSSRMSGTQQDCYPQNMIKQSEKNIKKQKQQQQIKYPKFEESKQEYNISNESKETKASKNAKNKKENKQQLQQPLSLPQQKKIRKNSYNETDSPKTINEIRKIKGLGQGSDQMKFMQVGDTSQFNTDSQVQIIKYEKINQDFINIVIKYQIAFNDFKVWRRYSQFQKLMKYLNKKYQGAILPQMPPKQGLKGNLVYFWGPDQSFLGERKQKLEILLKRLINSRFVSNDQTLYRFLTEQNFQVDGDSESTLSFSFNSIKDIALSLNARQIKDYGLAYYKYMSQAQINMNNDINELYEKIKKMIQTFTILNNYRVKINQNFKKRKDLLRQFDLQSNKKQGSQFDKILKVVSQQINDLHAQFKRYVKLKSQESWIALLIEQKEEQNKKQYIEKLQSIKIRISKMESNLLNSMSQFKQDKQKILAYIGDKMYLWRANVHP